MKLVIFGATGNVGRQLVYQALAQGHIVTAFVRDKTKLADIQHGNIRFAEGDVLNVLDVRKAVQGQDAVFCALGSGKSRKSTVRSQGTANIIRAMKDTGVERFIGQTTLGCGDSRGNLNFFWKRIMFGWYLKQVFQDHELQERYIMESPLSWTIVRPGAFTKGTVTGEFRHGFSGHDKSSSLKISPGDVACFMLAQLSTDHYLFKTPALSY